MDSTPALSCKYRKMLPTLGIYESPSTLLREDRLQFADFICVATSRYGNYRSRHKVAATVRSRELGDERDKNEEDRYISAVFRNTCSVQYADCFHE